MNSFLIDNQLPAALARWLAKNGQTASHVLDLQLAQTADSAIWTHAAQHGCVIITKDEDFAQMSLLRHETVQVVWIRLGNCRTPELLRVWQNTWPRTLQELESGARLIEVL